MATFKQHFPPSLSPDNRLKDEQPASNQPGGMSVAKNVVEGKRQFAGNCILHYKMDTSHQYFVSPGEILRPSYYQDYNKPEL